MSNWSGGVLTNVGRELQLKVEAGATLTFTKIKLGDGIESLEAVDDLTDLMSPKFVMGISSKSVANDVCKITGVLSSSSIATGFRAREWGLFAQDPDIGEILYMISIDTQPDWVPSGSDIGKLAVSYAMNVAVSNASSITARIDPAGLVTADMLAELIHETQYNKSYNVGDYAFTGYGLPAWAYLECIQEGTSGTIELDLSNVVEGERINDGTVVWIVRNWHSIHQYLVEATGYGIVSGLQVKAQSTPNMTVSIEGGTVHMKNGTRIVIAAIAALTIAKADATNPRIDSIYVDGTGNVAYAQGTPAATPVAPTLSTDAIKLADVKVAANQSSVTDANIIRNGEVKARYQNAGVVNAKDFGAKGDGVHDDTVAIQSAIDNNPNSLIYIPTGKYKITSTIKVIAPIVGDGYMRDVQNKENGTWIINDSDGYAFEINSSSNLNLFISRLSIYCNNDNGGIYADMNKHNLYHFEELGIFNVATYGMNICSTVGSSREVFMRDITIFGSCERKYYENTAIYLDGNSYDSRLTNIEIMGMQKGIVGTGVLYGSNWHIWLGDMFGKTNNQWWLNTTAVTVNSHLAVTNLYIDTARCGINVRNGGPVNISNFIWMNDENIVVDDTSDKADGFILWNNAHSTRPVTGAITNCELHLSPHANFPFVNAGDTYSTLKVSNVSVGIHGNESYESLAVSRGTSAPYFLPNSRIYDVEYSLRGVHINSARLVVIGKLVIEPNTYGIAELQIQHDGTYKGSIFIKVDNGNYARSTINSIITMPMAVPKFYMSQPVNNISTIYMLAPANDVIYALIKCPKSRNIGFLDLNATIGGNKYDFTTDVTDLSTLTELGV